MPRRCRVDPVVLSALLAPGRAVATHAELKAIGVPAATITRRIGPDGPWQRALPGVVVGHRGVMTTYERRLAALAYAGPDSVLTGLHALAEVGLPSAQRLAGGAVHVLVPHGCHRTAHGFALVARWRTPLPPLERRGLRCAPVARAVVDACRQLERLDDVRGLVAEAVQRRLCSVEDLARAVRAAARQRTALTRAVLREMAAGVRSVAEAKVRQAFSRAGVPEPLWNCDLFGPDGELIGSPDAYWDEGLAVEMDSMAWHLSPAAYRRTQRRQRRFALHGVEVLPYAPADALADPDALCREVLAKLAQLEGRRPPGVTARPRRVAV